MKKRYYFLLSALALVVLAAAFWAIPSITSASVSPVEQNAAIQLAAFEDEGAEYVGTVSNEVTGIDRLCYHSDATGRDYYYRADGTLLSIHTNHSSGDKSFSMILEEAELDQQMLEFATNCILPFKLGELVQARRIYGADEYSYSFREIYDGVETGTGVWLNCLPDGTVTYAAVSRGSSYEQTEDGEIVPLYDVNLTEEEAWEIALKAFQERVDGTGYAVLEDSLSMKREARGDQQFYTLEAEAYSEKEQYTVTYRVLVDVSDGSIYKIEFTQ